MADGFSEVVHQRTRLNVLTFLTESKAVSFGFLRDTLNLTDGNLSRHLRVLEEAEMVKIEKQFVGRRPLTTVSATPTGRTALTAHLGALQSVIDRVQGEQ